MIEPSHHTVFRRRGFFAGWPANHGLWQWDGHILVGFETGVLSINGGFHAIARSSSVVPWMAESADGGQTWECWKPDGPLELRSDRRPLKASDMVALASGLRYDLPGPIDFHRHLLKLRMLDMNCGPSYVNYSDDSGLSWHGPFAVDGDLGEAKGRAGILARTSYLTFSYYPHHCIAFLAAAKASDNHEGQPFCMETVDGGRTWTFLSWLDDPPHGGFGIMPSALWLDDGSILCCVRWRERGFQHRYGNDDYPFRSGIVCYRSDDTGRTWDLISIPARRMRSSGNPPDLVQLQDGRIALVYGWRDEPFGIAYQLSADCGKTWTKPQLVRDGAGCHDLGYTRSCVREDGKVVTVYYWCDTADGERYIAATIWESD